MSDLSDILKALCDAPQQKFPQKILHCFLINSISPQPQNLFRFPLLQTVFKKEGAYLLGDVAASLSKIEEDLLF